MKNEPAGATGARLPTTLDSKGDSGRKQKMISPRRTLAKRA